MRCAALVCLTLSLPGLWPTVPSHVDSLLGVALKEACLAFMELELLAVKKRGKSKVVGGAQRPPSAFSAAILPGNN